MQTTIGDIPQLFYFISFKVALVTNKGWADINSITSKIVRVTNQVKILFKYQFQTKHYIYS